jgi:hypothetical protein
VLHNAAPDLDAEGRPIIRIHSGEQVVSVGVAGSNLFNNDAAGLFTEQLIEARLHAELKRGKPPKASESDVTRDWDLLQKAMNGAESEVTARTRGPVQNGTQARAGNRP